MTTAHFADHMATDPNADNAAERMLRFLRAHALIIVAAMVIAAGAAVALSVTQPKRYAATATLLFSDPTQNVINPQGSTTLDPQRAADTNQQLLSLGVIAADASHSLHGKFTPDQITGDVNVGSIGQSNLLQIKATTPSAADSATVANAYANSFLAFQAKGARQQIDDAIARIRAQLTAPGTTSAQRQQLQGRLSDLTVARSVTGGGARLVQTAQPPSSPVSRHLVRNLLLALLIGLLIGIIIALLRDRLTDRLRHADEAEHLFGVPMLAAIPRTRGLEGKEAGPEMVSGVEAEPFRALRASLRYTGIPEEHRSIMFASPAPGDGKSTIARQLAAVMAAMGDSVVLVETDLNARPGNGLFARSKRGQNGSAGGGLTQLLRAEQPLAEENLRAAFRFVRLNRNGSGNGSGQDRWLAILPSGAPVSNPGEVLESGQMATLMEWLHRHFDTVIVDTPALGVVSDAMSLLPYCTGVVVVAALDRTTKDDAFECRRRLDLADTKVIGTVVNFAPPEATRYSYSRRPAGLLTRITG